MVKRVGEDFGWRELSEPRLHGRSLAHTRNVGGRSAVGLDQNA